MKVHNRLSSWEYIPVADRGLDEKDQTVFVLKGLPYDLYNKIMSDATPKLRMPISAMQKAAESQEIDASTEMELNPGTRYIREFDILSAGIVTVKNLIDAETGEAVEYKDTWPDNKKKEWFASWLPADLRVEIADAITRGSSLSKEELGN